MKCRLKPAKIKPEVYRRYTIKPLYESDRIKTLIHRDRYEASEFEDTGSYTLKDVFPGRNLDCTKVLEIACGTGDFLTDYAASRSEAVFIGVDYARPVVERAALKADAAGLDNILYYPGRIEDFLMHDMPEAMFDEVFINFPDPWPKKKHHKRRIVQGSLLSLLPGIMHDSTLLYVATDLDWLHEYHLEEFRLKNDLFCLKGNMINEIPCNAYKQVSSYQQKGQDKNRNIYYAVYEKI